MPDDSKNADFEKLAELVDELREQIAAIQTRIESIESVIPQPELPPKRSAEESGAEDASATEDEDHVEIIEAVVVDETPTPETVAAEESVAPSEVAEKQEDELVSLSPDEHTSSFPLAEKLTQIHASNQWEDIVGGRWMTWAGALTLIVAVAFFVPWAWTQLDLPAGFKVLLLHGLGLGFSACAFVLHRKQMKVFAQGLAGIGIFTFYASAWAAQHHYGIWGPSGSLATFLECALVTAVAIAAAVSSRSVAIVLLGALGGFVTPLIAGSSDPNHIGLFMYLAFLNIALVGSAVFRGWSFLKPIALLATIAMFALWQIEGLRPIEHTWSTQWLLTLHWFIFLLGATLPPVVWKRESNGLDLVGLTANSLWFVGTTWMLFHQRTEQQLALVCWGMTLLHLVLFGLTYNRVSNIDRMPRVHLALAAIFFMLAMPLQLEDSLSYLALAWAAQGVALTGVGIYFRDRQMCLSAIVVFALCTLRLLIFDFFDKHPPVYTINPSFLTFAISSCLMILGGTLYPITARFLRNEPENKPFWEPVGGVLMAVGNVLAMIGLTCQWEGRIVLLLWTIDASVIWAAGFLMARRPEVAREGVLVRNYAALLALVFVGGRVLYHGTDVNHAYTGEFTLLFNDRFLTLMLLGVVYFTAAWSYRKLVGASSEAIVATDLDKLLEPLLGLLACLLVVATFSLEIHSWFETDAVLGRRAGSMRMAEQASYSVLWSICAAAAVVIGLVIRWPVLRYFGLAGLAFTLAKVFFVDLASLVLFARILALAVLGLVLLAVSFIYQRFSANMKSSE